MWLDQASWSMLNGWSSTLLLLMDQQLVMHMLLLINIQKIVWVRYNSVMSVSVVFWNFMILKTSIWSSWSTAAYSWSASWAFVHVSSEVWISFYFYVSFREKVFSKEDRAARVVTLLFWTCFMFSLKKRWSLCDELFESTLYRDYGTQRYSIQNYFP